MRWTPQKWYNMQYIDMSGTLPMGIAGNAPRVRCLAAYPTARERNVIYVFCDGVLWGPAALHSIPCTSSSFKL